jgi:hypothetical protein
VSPRLSARARWRKFAYLLGPRREVGGLELRVLLPDKQELATVLAKVQEALDLIGSHDPRRSRRLHRDVKRIWVGATQHRGEYESELGMCILQLQYVLAPETSPARLALTIAHEAMHARLERMGIGYSEQLRTRVERACIAAEIDLAGRLPGAESLAEGARQRLEFDPAWFTDVAIQARGRETLKSLGWPGRIGAGMMRVLLWLDRRRAA